MRNKSNLFNIIMSVLLALLALSSCSEEAIADFKDNLFTALDYETTLTVVFDSEDDMEEFQKRLDILNISILSANTDGDTIDYCLHSHYPLTESECASLGRNLSDAVIVNPEHETMLEIADIVELNFDGAALNIYTDDEFYNDYDEDAIYQSSIKIDGEIYKMSPFLREDGNRKYIQYNTGGDTPRSVLIEFAIAYASKPFVGNVLVTFHESKMQ